MTLNYQDLRQALTEFDQIIFEGRMAGWDNDPAAEKTALLAARRILGEIDGYLHDHLSDINDEYTHPPAGD